MATPFLPGKTLREIADLGLSESQVLNVYSNGRSVTLSSGAKAMVEKYSGYEVSLLYKNRSTGEPVITTAWKRPRR